MYALGNRTSLPRLDRYRTAHLAHQTSLRVYKGGLDCDLACGSTIIGNIGADIDIGTLAGNIVEMHEHSTTCNPVSLYGISNRDRRLGYHPHITVYAAMIGKIE